MPVLVALLAGLLPLLGVNVAYVLAASAEQVPACFPYFEGCTSVSATGREPPASFFFRGAMLPASVLMLLYWWLARRWLALHADHSATARALPWMGLAATLFLVIYTNVLGVIGEWYAIYRRIGVVMYFSMTFFAQLLFTSRIERLARAGVLRLPRWMVTAKVGLCGFMLLLGLISIPATVLMADSKTAERILEWDFSLLLVLYFPLTAFAWYADDFRVQFSRGLR